MRKSTKYWLLPIISIYCCACNTADDNVAGGPCTYKYDTIPARIITIDSVDSNNHNLILAIEKTGLYKTDTIDLHKEFGNYVTPGELQHENIHVNDSLIFVTGKIISGSCNPHAGTTIKLKHYKK